MSARGRGAWHEIQDDGKRKKSVLRNRGVLKRTSLFFCDKSVAYHQTAVQTDWTFRDAAYIIKGRLQEIRNRIAALQLIRSSLYYRRSSGYPKI